MIRLYGKNRQHVAQGRPCYWTDVKGWRKQRKRITGQAPLVVNVASKSKLEDFRNLSPMRMGPVPCYREKGKLITAVSVEVAWQYSKIYSHVLTPAGKLVDISRRFLTQDAQGRPVPTEAWFAWRNAAFTHPGFHHTHPDFVKSKPLIRRAFPKGSVIAYWYWKGRLLNAVQARQQIYAQLYCRFVRKTPGFQLLQEIAVGRDVHLFDFDGYDWQTLGKTPAECLQDCDHSFGHGMVISFLLQNINPTKLVPPQDHKLL